MTTIAYDGKSVAADGLSILGAHYKYLWAAQKLWSNIGPFKWLGASGDYQYIQELIETLSKLKTLEEANSLDIHDILSERNTEFLCLTHEGELWCWRGSRSFKLDANLPFAIGSGQDYAIGAMHCGSTAKEAVKVASHYDLYTNNNVKVISNTDE